MLFNARHHGFTPWQLSNQVFFNFSSVLVDARMFACLHLTFKFTYLFIYLEHYLPAFLLSFLFGWKPDCYLLACLSWSFLWRRNFFFFQVLLYKPVFFLYSFSWFYSFYIVYFGRTPVGGWLVLLWSSIFSSQHFFFNVFRSDPG